MYTRILAVLLALALGAVLVGCAAEAPDSNGTPDVGAPGDAAGGAAGLRLANGIYDQEDGSVIALGVLEWVDLEGGFYALTGAPESEGGGTIAVINNAEEFDDELEALLGKTVQVTGVRFDGATIRMAGPEIVIDSVDEISDTPGVAE